MDPMLKPIADIIQSAAGLTDTEKELLLRSIAEADKAQAREEQIQLALEAVRAKTMAMQESEELAETSFVLFQQFKELGETSEQISIGIFNEEAHEMELYSTLYGSQWKDSAKVDLDEPVVMRKIHQAWKQQKKSLVIDIAANDLREYNAYRKTLSDVEYRTDRWVIHIAFFSKGVLTFSAAEPHGAIRLLERFATVFEQTYTRFLDLQKAEAQARESQIEAALERVRSRSMGMQKSDELKEVIQIIYDQFVQLNIKIGHTGFVIDYKARDDYDIWIADPLGVPSQVTVPYFDSVYYNRFNEAKEKGINFFATNLTFEEKNRFYQKLFEYVPGLPQEAMEFYFNCPGLAISTVLLENVCLYIENFSGIPYSDDENATLMRFGNVFQQTFTRFLDLQKAEAQAREAQIEAALERTRTQSMIMQHSKELDDTLRAFHEQVLLLGIKSAFSFLWLPDEDKDRHIFWATWAEDLPAGESGKNGSTAFNSKAINYPLDRNEPATAQCLNDWKGDEPVVSYHVPPTGVESYFAAWKELIDGVEKLKPEYFSAGMYYVEAFMKYGCFGVLVEKELPEAEKKILLRFSTEFERTYTRFLDLKKAEERAREAKIEAALEKVRAKAMAMHKSDDLNDAVAMVFEELDKLDLGMARCGIGILDREKRTADVYSTTISDQGTAVQVSGDESMDIHPLLQRAFDAWLRQDDLTYVLHGQDLIEYYNAVGATNIKLPRSQAVPEIQYYYVAMFQAGGLFAFRETAFPEEAKAVMKRFAAVFNLTYTRFSDLQRAEAQARQAQIEMAMEKVRARALAMQKPEELAEVAQVLRKEMGLLGVEELETSSIYIHDEVSGTTECWYAIQDIRGKHRKLVSDNMTISLQETWVGREMLKFHDSSEKQASIVMKGENRKEWINYCAQHSKVLQGYYGDTVPERTYHLLKFSNGYMGAASPGDISEESWELLQRATSVFSLAYKRFSDLQLAEAGAKEAVRQASLDRVRANIASMRTTSDLDRITPLIWNELTILGLPFIRCGVFIMDEEQQQVQSFLSAPDGKAIAAFRQPYNAPGELAQVIEHWRTKKMYKQHWNEAQFIEFTKNLVQQGAVTSGEKYLTENRPTNLYLHFLPFIQGMLYVGNTAPLGDEQLQLVQNLGDAFATAYARYEDFNKLDAAKQQVDKTLVELKQAQTQLVQSEKMASLGELTAGIAHEIQNPLNFVNNFAEVSNELLEEMKCELSKGNNSDAIAIAEDVKQNLEKINHHGKRADAIVKSMLQHSRTSSAKRESTDINALADEYLRLAYHGLRAKDKSFNAMFETDFDSRIGKLDIMVQDMGRVILNLINNAFYAVTEKKKQSVASYEPTVRLSTKRRGDMVEIRILDNGTGIPQKVLDKIFQPFFTTKPTGQGTGLGLSLSYDIIKAHGGELKVATNEGEGSEFIIQIPILTK